jgi:hypothetical protein
MQTPSAAAPHITPRNPKLKFSALPKYWFGGNAALTHMANGVNLLFPLGERFFVRSVRRYEDKVKSPTLRAAIKAFYAQEGRHAQLHERQFETLREQGFEIDAFMRRYQFVAYDVVEKACPAALSLATTAALEHFTAIMAEDAFREGHLDQAHPVMRKLLLWHAAEEIEHKDVAFDVLMDQHPSYALRMAGLFVGAVSLAAGWYRATRMLVAQDTELDKAEFRRQMKALEAERPVSREVFLRGIREYMRPDFHPNDKDNRGLATEFLEALMQEHGAEQAA